MVGTAQLGLRELEHLAGDAVDQSRTCPRRSAGPPSRSPASRASPCPVTSGRKCCAATSRRRTHSASKASALEIAASLTIFRPTVPGGPIVDCARSASTIARDVSGFDSRARRGGARTSSSRSRRRRRRTRVPARERSDGLVVRRFVVELSLVGARRLHGRFHRTTAASARSRDAGCGRTRSTDGLSPGTRSGRLPGPGSSYRP